MTNSPNYFKQTLMNILKNKKIVISGIVITFVIAILITPGMAKSNDLELSIEKEKIPEEEFLHVISSEKHDVTQYFFREYGAEVDENFWEQEYEGEYPYRMLVDNTLETLKKIHATYEIAKEKGNIDEAGFEALKERFELVNSDREKKIKNGEPVYGLAEFSLDVYIEYEMDELQKMYVNDPDNEGMSLSEKEGRDYYEKYKDRMFVKNDDMELEYIQIYYAALELEDNEVDSLEKDLLEISKNLSNGMTMDSLVTDYENLQPYYQHEDILSEEVSARSKEIGDVLELAEDLEKGKSTQVINQNGSLYLIRCIDRVNYDYVPYEQVENYIFKTLREENYDQLVADKAKQISVSGDMAEIYGFAEEQLKNE